MGDNLHDCLKRKASLLSLNSHFLLSVAPDSRPRIYPFSLHCMKSEDDCSVYVSAHVCLCVGGIPKLTSQISRYQMCFDNRGRQTSVYVFSTVMVMCEMNSNDLLLLRYAVCSSRQFACVLCS